MTDVIIAGIGQTPAGEHWDISLRELAYDAVSAAIKDSGGLHPQALYAGNMLAANLSRQAHLGVLLADFCGLPGIEAASIEAGGASGGAALRQGYLAVASGLVEVALVIGVEKFTDVTGPDVAAALATTTDSDFEAVQGVTPAAQGALLKRRYLHEFDLAPDSLAGFSLTAHANAVTNPNAAFHKAVTLETYLKAAPISDPLNMLDIAPSVDGAAALILTRRELLPPEFFHPLVHVAGSALAIDKLALHDRPDPLHFEAARIASAKAIQQAGIHLDQIDLFEYDDAFSVYAALSLEASGFAQRGEGWKLASEGAISLKGKLPCATFGGSKARGNIGGATGVYQAVEAATQLRGQAGANQAGNANVALIQSLGGPASTAISHVLTRIG